jgi:hypothetical protein
MPPRQPGSGDTVRDHCPPVKVASPSALAAERCIRSNRELNGTPVPSPITREDIINQPTRSAFMTSLFGPPQSGFSSVSLYGPTPMQLTDMPCRIKTSAKHYKSDPPQGHVRPRRTINLESLHPTPRDRQSACHHASPDQETLFGITVLRSKSPHLPTWLKNIVYVPTESRMPFLCLRQLL